MRRCFKDVTGFDDRMVLFIGLPLSSMLISLLLFSDQYVAGNWRFLSVCIPMSFAYTGAFWAALRWTYYQVKGRYPAMSDIGKRLFWMLLAFLVVYVAVNFLLGTLFSALGLDHGQEPAPVVKFISALMVSALVIATYEVLSFYLQLQRAVAEKAELERRNVESQLEGLRNQVNPHFLFNSLNTLVYLIPEEPEKAVRFVQQLSKVYRYVLESRDARIIPLQEELDFLHSYVFLLKERFGENLRVHLRGLNGHSDGGIVPLTLQMLFENAIKHNVLSTEKPLIIEVFAENGRLVVRNNLQKKNQVLDSTGVGLENIRARYRMLTDREVETIVSREYFTVLLPMVEREKVPETEN
ncbi:MAG: histidine kinase [Saprospiraceae bacterium]|jgi:two-component system LytT family sensor kinase|nr:histidine kinase [Saprospiraceae bacterium]